MHRIMKLVVSRPYKMELKAFQKPRMWYPAFQNLSSYSQMKPRVNMYSRASIASTSPPGFTVLMADE